MTHHDTVIDSIIQHIYAVWSKGPCWDESIAKEKAQLILETVEEFQQKRKNLEQDTIYSQWKATD